MTNKQRILSGMRPTGPLHLGHWVGALKNWTDLQKEFDCFFMVADWHALMSEYESPSQIQENSRQMVRDWLAAGIDPQHHTLFRQSDVPEHLELHMVLSIITPLGWVERVPTYKEQLREIKGRDLTTYGFLGYPILQAADILLYRANVIPVGQDQVPHLELTREIVRRFKSLYKADLFPEPKAMLTEEAKLLGLDGRKMSKSYNNAMALAETPDVLLKKSKKMFTDPKRIKMSDPGHPETCNVCHYWKLFAPERADQAWEECRTSKRGCTQNKEELAAILTEKLEPFQKARESFSDVKVEKILADGAEAAQMVAKETILEVKKAVGLK